MAAAMTTLSKQPKILFVSRACRPDAGGMERLSYELITGLSEDRSVKTTSVIHTGSRASSPLFVFTSLQQVLQAAKNADVVHLGDPMLSLAGFLCKTILGKKVAVTVHGLDIAYPNPLYQLYLKLFFRHFDIYLPISTYVAGLLKTQHNPSGSVTVINPGIHDAYYDPAVTRSTVSTLLKTDVTDKILLYTNGRLTRRKGHAWFIANVLPNLPQNVLYVISGAGQEEKNITRTADAVHVSNRVILTGRMKDKEATILYNSCDAFIQPNIPIRGDTEGFGLVVVEAASCAKQVFAADIEGIKDAITNSKNGRLLPAGDAKQWISALSEWIKNYSGQTSAEAVYARTFTLEKFSWDKVIPKYKAALLTQQS